MFDSTPSSGRGRIQSRSGDRDGGGWMGGWVNKTPIKAQATGRERFSRERIRKKEWRKRESGERRNEREGCGAERWSWRGWSGKVNVKRLAEQLTTGVSITNLCNISSFLILGHAGK